MRKQYEFYELFPINFHSFFIAFSFLYFHNFYTLLKNSIFVNRIFFVIY